MMTKFRVRCFPGGILMAALLLSLLPTVSTVGSDNPYIGRWALTIPGGGAGWLGVTQERGFYDASILWGGGSVVPVASVFFADNVMYVLRIQEVRRKDADGKVIRTQQYPELLIASLQGDQLNLKRLLPRQNGEGIVEDNFNGQRIPPLPPAPDLSQVAYAAPVTLFNGRDLTGWRLTSDRQKNGWRAENGILINNPVQPEGQPHVAYGNLRTVREFEDFNLTLETRVSSKGNSGIYLRGIYEVQVSDTYGKPLDSHNMGGIYSRITPAVSAEKPAGQWQSFDITLVDRHVTVILNGKKIIDNQPLLGCTGGALWSDEFKSGPLYLQGDHTGIEYRNIVIRPVIK